MQHLVGRDFHHRRSLDKRQILTVITSVVEERRTTYTTEITTRAPIISIIRRPTTTSSVTSASVTSTTSSRASAVSSGVSATQRPTASSSSVSSTVPLSSSAPTSRPTEPAPSSDAASVLTVRVTETIPSAPSAPSASASDLNAGVPVGAKSAGQIVGIVVGIIVGVIGVAIFAAFIVRHMRKRARDKEAWDASKFRNSALLLRDEKNGSDGGAGAGGPAKAGPRPPSMIERRAAAPTGSMIAPSRAYPFTDGAGVAGGYNPQDQLGYNRGPGTPQPPQQYGAPNPYGAAPMPYSGQNMYGQGADRGYGNAFGSGSGYGHQGMDLHHPGFPTRQNGHNSLPPFSSYGPPLDMDGGAMGRSNSTTSSLPNPFSECAPAQGLPSRDSASSGHGSGISASVPSNNTRLMTRNVDDDEQPQGEAPPAYSDDGTYAKMQRDVKTPVVMTVQGTRNPADAAAPAPAATIGTPTTTEAGNKARPVSSHTVYDPTDAYGGI